MKNTAVIYINNNEENEIRYTIKVFDEIGEIIDESESLTSKEECYVISDKYDVSRDEIKEVTVTPEGSPAEEIATLDDEECKKQLEENSSRAKRLLEDDSKMNAFLQRLEKKFRKIPKVGDKLAYIPLFVMMVRSYMKKEYRMVPVATIMAIVAVLIYFVSPVDAIPDFIPVIGFADDAAMMAFCFKMFKEDIDDYLMWEKNNKLKTV